MKPDSAKAIAQNQPDSAAGFSDDMAPVPHEKTSADNKADLNRLHAHMIVETLTPFLGVLIGLQPESPPSRRVVA